MIRWFMLFSFLCLFTACGTAHGWYSGNHGDDDTLVGDDDASFEKVQDFTWTDTDGNPVHLYDLAGNVVLLNVAAGWCVNCKQETPSLEKDIWRRFRDRNFILVQLIYQDPSYKPADQAYAKEWKSEFGLDYVVCPDPDDSLHPYFLEEALPFSMLLDPDLGIRLRSHQYDVDAFTAMIEELL
jgi:peroxiredoxin